MKKLILLSSLLIIAIFATAQRGGGDPDLRAQKRVDRLSNQLDLSKDQQAQIKEIYIAQGKERKANRKNHQNLSQEEKAAARTARKEAKMAFDAKMATVLTPEQNTKYQQLAKEYNDNKRPRGAAKYKRGKYKKDRADRSQPDPAKRAQKRVDYLTKELDLDAQQQKSVYELVFNAAPKTKNKDWKSLSKEEKETIKSERKAAKANFESELSKILSPAQLTTYLSLPKKEKGRRGKKGKMGKKKENKG